MRLLIVTAAATAILTLVLVLGTQVLYRRFHTEPTCTTCGTRSGHRVTGHTDLHCRQYVQDARRRAAAHATATGQPAPDLTTRFGHAWPIEH